MQNFSRLLEYAEYLSIAVSFICVLLAFSSNSWPNAIIAIFISLLLNLANRFRLEDKFRRRLNSSVAKINQEAAQQGDALQLEVAHARGFATALVKQTLATHKLEEEGEDSINVQSLSEKLAAQKSLIKSSNMNL